MLQYRPTAQQRRAWADRRRNGSAVTFNGKTYYVYTQEVAANKAGTIALSVEQFGVYIAAAEPRVFNFSPLDFKPYTAVAPPVDGSIVEWMGWNYLITRPSAENKGGDTQDVLCHGYRYIDQARTGL